jgi:hypothetical protein
VEECPEHERKEILRRLLGAGVVPNAVRISTNNLLLTGSLCYAVRLRGGQITRDKQAKTVEFSMFLFLLTYTELNT